MAQTPRTPSASSTSPATDDAPAVRLDGVTISVHHRRGSHPLATDLELEIGKGEILGLVGESGSGKSITAMACMGLLPNGLRVTSGSVSICGVDMTGASERDWNRMRGTEVSMIFQDPMTSLDPCFSVGTQIVEAVKAHQRISDKAARRLAVDMLGEVGIPDPTRRFDAFPHEFSGGLRQRAMIAGALVLEPTVLIADEPTTALDVTTQAQIVDLVVSLCAARSMSVLWISHDLAVVNGLADRVAVMYAGELVEAGQTSRVFLDPRHHYTRGLLSSASHGRYGEPFGFIEGVVPEPTEWGDECRFGTRCDRFDEACRVHPAFLPSPSRRWYRCHHPLGEEDR